MGIDEEKGKIIVAFLTSWYDEHCSECLHFKHIDAGNKVAYYCEQIEKEEPCTITGIRHVGEINGIET